MSKWATIDKEALQREIEQRSAALDVFGDRRLNHQEAFEAYRLLAEHNALMVVLCCISRPASSADREGMADANS